jgi:cytochrome c-type biogenesis protein CcmF
LIVHTGIVIIAVAIASSSAYTTRKEVRLERGESAKVASYTVTYVGSEVERSDQKNTFIARVRVERGGDDLGVYAPAISTFPGAPQGIGTPSVRTGLREDVYLTLISSPNEQGRVTIGVAINPMVMWLWMGGGVMALGTLVALSPGLRRRARPTETEEEPAPVEPALREREEALT